MWLWLFLLLGQPQEVPSCPLLSAHPVEGGFAWEEIRIPVSISDLETALGTTIEGWVKGEIGPEIVFLTLHGRKISLEGEGTGKSRNINGLTLFRAETDSPECWSLGSLVRQVKKAFPGAKYLPSPHDPDLAETENPIPMYTIDPNRGFVVLLKPDEGFVYLGDLLNLD